MVLQIDEFQKPEFQGYVENVPRPQTHILANILPAKTTKDINFSYNVINGVYAPIASITGFNASAPLRDKKEMAPVFGALAKVQHGVRLDEVELLKFNKPRDTEEQQQVIDYVYDTTDDLVRGVHDVEEYMRAQALYTGKLVYDDNVNNVHLNIDFGIPTENKLTASKVWSDPSSTPLQDLQAAVKQFQANNGNQKPVVMHMTSATEANLLQNNQIRTQIFGTSTDKRLIMRPDVQNVFTALGLPPYIVNDDVINDGGTQKQLLADNKVVLLGAQIGETMFGPSVEKNYDSGIWVNPIIGTNPPSEEVYVGETVFPAIKRPKSIVILSV